MKYKPSKYNFQFEHKGIPYIYNCAYGGLTQLNNETVSIVKELVAMSVVDDDATMKYESIATELIKQCFLIPHNRDELGMLRVRNNVGRFRRKDVGYSIIPTLKCNLKCKYCYENALDYGEDVTMNEEVCHKVINAIVEDAKGSREVWVCWYGGEPLLNLSAMKLISKGLKERFAQLDMKLDCMVVTNGVLLGESFLDVIRDLNVRIIQVTLDGPPLMHDARRPLSNGRGSFAIIIKNLENLLLRHKEIFVSINVVTDKENIDMVDQIFTYIDSITHGDMKKNIKISFSPTYCSESNQARITCAIMDFPTFCKAELRLIEESIKRGYLYRPYPRRRMEGCTADKFDPFIIGPHGELYKCFMDVGIRARTVGYIEGSSFKTNDNLIPWLSWDPVSDKKCGDCFILPICMGGCPRRAILEPSNCELRCDRNKYSLQEILQIYLETQKQSDILFQSSSFK
ncbi:radical SAM protein [Candidatus Bathyarchaeota archaeon]|nr:radical SAM protein [Candidatus Bathyarchaeota archaeon]